MTDESLIARYRAGDSDAFNQLADRYQERLYQLAWRMLGSREDALDAVQEILLRLTEALTRFRGEAKFSTFLYRLATHICIDYRRKLHRHAHPVSLDPDIPVAAPASPESLCEEAFRQHLIDQAIRELPETQRQLLVLRDREGLSNQEVAEILGIEVGTMKARLHRARAALRRILERGVTVAGREQYGSFQVTPTGSLV